MKVKEESEKVGLKLDIQKTKIMASGPITLWQIDMEAVSVFIFWGSKITADGDCSHEIVMWDVRCGCESWTIKKAERRRIDAFELVLEKTLESPLDCKEIQPAHPKGDQSWVFIGRTDVEAEIPNTLATWCEELTHWKRPWCWERLKAGGEGDDRDGWMASLTQWTWVWVNSGSWWWTGRPGVLWFMGLQRVRHDWVTELNWTSSVHWRDCYPSCSDDKVSPSNAGDLGSVPG